MDGTNVGAGEIIAVSSVLLSLSKDEPVEHSDGFLAELLLIQDPDCLRTHQSIHLYH